MQMQVPFQFAQHVSERSPRLWAVSQSHENNPGKAADHRPESTLTWVGLIGLWALGTWLRVRHVGDALLFGDELHSLRDMQGGYFHTLSHFSETGAGLALPLLQRVLIFFDSCHHQITLKAFIFYFKFGNKTQPD